MPRLVVHTNQEKYTVALSEVATVGRDPNSTIRVDSRMVSRKHLTITKKDGSYVLSDHGSQSGTYVNGSRVSADVVLKRGDEIKFGDVRAWYEEDDPKTAAAKAKPEPESGNTDTPAPAAKWRRTPAPTRDAPPPTLDAPIPPGVPPAETPAPAATRIAPSRGFRPLEKISGDAALLSASYERLHKLFDAFGAVCAARTLTSTQATIVSRLVSITNADAAGLYLRGRDGRLEQRATKRRDGTNRSAGDTALAEHVAAHRNVLYAHDAEAELRPVATRSLRERAIESVLAAPLFRFDGESMGVLWAESAQKSFFHPLDIEAMTVVASVFARALEVAMTYPESRVVMVDEPTMPSGIDTLKTRPQGR